MSQYTRLINRSHPLSPDYRPVSLIDAGIPFDAPLTDPKRLLEPQAAYAARELFALASSCDIQLYGISGYRSYSRQSQLYNGSSQIAPPGASEHQSGLALDVSCLSIGLNLSEKFADTPEGKWLYAHAPLYGFILRYPKDKQHITGSPWHPCHIRYVTKSLSVYLKWTGMTLEEYHQLSHCSI